MVPAHAARELAWPLSPASAELHERLEADQQQEVIAQAVGFRFKQ